MNNRGFSTVLIIVLILIVVIVVAIVPSAISRNNQKQGIENQINSLSISAPVQSKQCSGGDGVDSGSQCRFTYSDNGSAVESALKNAGYTSKFSNQTEAGGSTSSTFTGGNPPLNINVSVYNGVTTLDASMGN